MARDNTMNTVKLLARDKADIDIISAYAQDAIVQIDDITYQKEQNRFILLLSRFMWEKENKQRIRSALRIEAICAARFRGLNLSHKKDFISLLSLYYDAATQRLRLIFSGKGEIELELDYCHIILEDIGESWQAQHIPRHEEER